MLGLLPCADDGSTQGPTKIAHCSQYEWIASPVFCLSGSALRDMGYQDVGKIKDINYVDEALWQKHIRLQVVQD